MSIRSVSAFLAAVVACGPAAPASAPQQPSTPPTRQPLATAGQRSALAVDPPLINFGTVAPGTKHPARFTLRNTGAEPLTIAKAQPSCKCTDISDIAGKTIPPGGSLELTAALQVPKSPGEKDAKVMITVQGQAGMVLAQMVADVTMPVRTLPAFVDALKGKSEGTITLSSVDGKPFRVLAAGGRAPALVGFDGAKDAPRAEYVLKWTLADLGPGQIPQWWIVDTDRADCPQVPLRIRHETTGVRFDPGANQRFWFVPESVVLAGVAKPGQPISLTTTIEHLNPAAQGAVTNPQWSEVKEISVPGGEGSATLGAVTRRGTDFADIAFEYRPAAGARGPMYVPVQVETGTGKGLVFVAVTVTP